ncbi:MAG: tyrosine-type recombinase/integrase [Bacillota bacterium]|nr:tyrosine-type recombinase/integrase [Bacillota bacterium]
MPERVPVYLNKKELQRLLAAPAKARRRHWLRDRAALEILALAGLRRSELIALNWDDLDFGAGTITVRHAKGNRQRVVPMHPVLKEHLWEYLQSRLPLTERAVIVGDHGHRIDPKTL